LGDEQIAINVSGWIIYFSERPEGSKIPSLSDRRKQAWHAVAWKSFAPASTC